MIRLSCILALLSVLNVSVLAQSSEIHASIEAQIGALSSKQVPFWLRSNQYGSIPLEGLAGSIIASVGKDYDSSSNKLMDWGLGFEGRGNLGKASELLLIEAYAKMRLSIFELKAGRSKDVMGLMDTTLSSGSFSISGNALGIPKVEVSVPDYYALPFWGELVAFKGNFAHGWLGEIPVQYTPRYQDAEPITQNSTYFHQKSFYGRLGKPHWKVKLYGGFNHQVFWGNSKKLYGSEYGLDYWNEYMYAITGKVFGGEGTNVESSKVGNHLGSIDLGFEYNFKEVKLFAYRQNFFDVGALYYLANIKDGLNGISVTNTNFSVAKPGLQWKKLLLEFLYTKNQAGLPSSKTTKSGDEDYYNNYLYREGWSYQGLGLGTPFIVPEIYVRNGFAYNPSDYFISNRVIALHTAFAAGIGKWSLTSKFSFSKHYGTYGTSIYGKSTGSKFFPPQYGLFEEAIQLSAYLDVERSLKKDMVFGLMSALDVGQLNYNTSGLIFTFKKKF